MDNLLLRRRILVPVRRSHRHYFLSRDSAEGAEGAVGPGGAEGAEEAEEAKDQRLRPRQLRAFLRALAGPDATTTATYAYGAATDAERVQNKLLRQATQVPLAK